MQKYNLFINFINKIKSFPVNGLHFIMNNITGILNSGINEMDS